MSTIFLTNTPKDAKFNITLAQQGTNYKKIICVVPTTEVILGRYMLQQLKIYTFTRRPQIVPSIIVYSFTTIKLNINLLYVAVT